MGQEGLTPEQAGTLRAFHVILGRLILLQAKVAALESAFIASQKKRGADEEAIRRGLAELERVYAEHFLTDIGEKNPEVAESADIQGLLAKMLERLTSDDVKPGDSSPKV